jgi:hypothetical protein
MQQTDASDNPAIERQTSLPPALLEALDTDPEAMTPHYKKMLAVQAYRLHKLMGSPSIPVGQRVQVAEFFAKISGSDKKTAAVQGPTGPAFSVQIVFSGKKAEQLPDVVDVKATETPPAVEDSPNKEE